MNALNKVFVAGGLALAVISVGERAARAQDPGTPGTHSVATDNYTYGDTAFTPLASLGRSSSPARSPTRPTS